VRSSRPPLDLFHVSSHGKSNRGVVLIDQDSLGCATGGTFDERTAGDYTARTEQPAWLA
jgi:hypothetical protein